MGDVQSDVVSGSSAAQSVLLSAAKAAEHVDSSSVSPNFIKGGPFLTNALSFLDLLKFQPV